MKAHHKESGNVFIFILLGVALFGALMFTVSKSMQTQSATQMSARDAKLAALDILDYAQKLERAVGRVSRKGASENDISFETDHDAAYAPNNPQPPEHRVFNSLGGSTNWIVPPPGVNDGSDWLITGKNCIANVGTGGSGCSSDNLQNEELLLILPNIDANVCMEINKVPGISIIPTDSGPGYSTAKFKGTFDDGAEIVIGSPHKTVCYQRSGNYYFYHVLMVR